MESKLLSKGFIFFIVAILIGFNFYELKQGDHPIPAKQEGLRNYLVLPSVLFSDVKLDTKALIDDDVEENAASSTIPKDIPNIVLSLILLPFFLIGHLLALTFDYATNGSSPPYVFMLHFANLLFSLAAITFLFKLVARYFNLKTTVITLILIVFGTNFFTYSTQFVGYSNLLNLFLITAFIYLVVKYKAEQSKGNILLLSVLFAIVVALNPINTFVILLPVLLHYNDKKLPQQINALLNNWERTLLPFFAVVILSSICFQWVLNTLPEGYSKGKYFFSNPHVYAALLEYRKGWLIYTPIMIFGLIGLLTLLFNKKVGRNLAIGAIIYIAIYVYVSFSFWNWWYTESFSQRMMIDTYAFFALGLAVIVGWVLKKKQFVLRFWAVLLGIFFIYLNIFQSNQFKKELITSNSMTENAYWAVFGETEKPKKYDCYLAEVDLQAAYNHGETKVSYQKCDNAKQLSADRFQDYKEEGSRNYVKNGVYIFGKEKEIGIPFKSVQNAKGISVSLDENDSYELNIYSGDELLHSFLLKNEKEMQGLRVYELNLPEEISKAGFDYIKVKPIEGDDFYAMGHLILTSDSMKDE